MFQLNNRTQTFKINRLNPITISGFSRSAYRTGYLVQPYGIYLDAGHHPTSPSNLILLSHGHYDHIASLYPILLEAKKPEIILPKSIVSYTQQMLNSINLLEGHRNQVYLNWTPITDTEYTTNINSKQVFVEQFRLDHKVESIGFGISEFQNKLKNQFADLSSKEIGKLKKQNIEITEKIKVPILLFISDTSSRILGTLPFQDYSLVVIECTFIEEEHYQEAVNRKHIHWMDLKPYIKSNPETTFILGHFSCRYKDEYLLEIETKFREETPNIIFWI